MKKILSLFLVSSLLADTHLGLVFWQNWHSNKNGTVTTEGDLKVTGTNNYFGAAVRLPFSLLMGSSLEAGMSFLPDQQWESAATKINVTGRKSYLLNTLYPLSEAISILAGASYNKQNLACTSGCNQVKAVDSFTGKLGIHAGIQWLFPVVDHVASGVRVLYSIRGKHKYCYGLNNCSTNFEKSDGRMMFQAVASVGL